MKTTAKITTIQIIVLSILTIVSMRVLNVQKDLSTFADWIIVITALSSVGLLILNLAAALLDGRDSFKKYLIFTIPFFNLLFWIYSEFKDDYRVLLIISILRGEDIYKGYLSKEEHERKMEELYKNTAGWM